MQSLRTMILGRWTWSQLRASLRREPEAITHHRQQRTHQESLLLEHLPTLLSQGCPLCPLA